MQATTMTFTCPHCDHKVETHDVSDGDIITCNNPMCRQQFEADIPKASPEPGLIVPGESTDEATDRHESEAPNQEAVQAIPVEQKEPVVEGPESAVAPQPQAAGTTVHASEEPQIIMVHHAPMFRRYPVQFLINVAMIVLGVAGVIVGLSRDAPVAAWLAALPLFVGLFLQVKWWLEARRTTLTVTTRGIVLTKGLFNVTTREVHHDMIHSIHIYQPKINSWLRSGALLLVCGPTNEQVYLDAVSNPHKVAETIRQQAGK